MIKQITVLCILTIAPAYGAWHFNSIPDQSGPPGGPALNSSNQIWNTDTLGRQAYVTMRPLLTELEKRRDQAAQDYESAKEAAQKADELVRNEEEAIRQAQERLTKARSLQQLLKKNEISQRSQWLTANQKYLGEKHLLVG